MSTPDVPPEAGELYRRYLSAVMLHGHAAAKACELGATDLYALNILRLDGALTPGELGRRTGLTTGPTTRLIDRLEAAGYVRRVPSPDDRRKVIVSPVGAPAGLDQAMAPARERIGELLATYSPDQLKVLLDYFNRAADAYQASVDQLRTASAP